MNWKPGMIATCIRNPKHTELPNGPREGKEYPVGRVTSYGGIVISDILEDGMLRSWVPELFIKAKPKDDRSGNFILGVIEFGELMNFKG